MELIPILSLIILVSTISTFILAVGAYVLYKVRERKGRTAKAQEPETIPAELIEPAQLVQDKRFSRTTDAAFLTADRRTFDGTRATRYDSTRERGTGFYTKPTYVTKPTYAEDNYKKNGKENGEQEKFPTRSRFTRYSAEYEQDPKRQKKEDSLQWR